MTRAAMLDKRIGPRGLRVRTIPPPSAGDRVVIDVSAAGAGFPDLLATYGKHQLTPNGSFAPGLEVSGVVRKAPRSSPFKPGQKVMAFTSGFGGFADTVAVPASLVFPAPKDFTAEQAATFVLNYHTAFFALTVRTQLRASETVMVLGASGGLGMAMMHVSKALGARVIGVASTSVKREMVLSHGAASAFPADMTLRERVTAESPAGVDVVIDTVGGELSTEALRCLAPGGRLLSLGYASGQVPSVSMNRLLLRNTAVLGVAWGPTVLPESERAAFVLALEKLVADHSGVRPFVSRIFDLDDAGEALTLIENREAIGRVVLRCADVGGWLG